MIKIHDLKFTYPDNSFDLKIDNLEIAEKSKVSIFGPSGSGKSTFLSLLAGNLNSSKGSIHVNGQSYQNLSPKRMKRFRLENIGIIFQQPCLVEWMSVKDNILLASTFLKNSSEIKSILHDLCTQLGIKELLNKNAGDLSLGEQMRASIVRAIINKPSLILADEPTASLDSKNQQIVNELLCNFCNENGSTLILVSHDNKEIDLLDQKLSSKSWELE